MNERSAEGTAQGVWRRVHSAQPMLSGDKSICLDDQQL
jgi:hypothetical protein